jgi:hypothetical protein
MTRWLLASLIALSIAITADHARASTVDASDRQSEHAAVETATPPPLRDAWKKALLYVALLGAALYGSRLYRNYVDELDDPLRSADGSK